MPKFYVTQKVRVKFVYNPENKHLEGKEFMVIHVGEINLPILGPMTSYELNCPLHPRYGGFLEEQLEAAVPPEDFDTQFMIESLIEGTEERRKLPEVIEHSTSKELICVPQR